MTGKPSYEDLEQRIRDLEEQSKKRLQTETVLNETLQRLNFHIENTPLAVVELNHRFQISYWSRQAEKIFGWKAEEVLGKGVEQLRWVHEEDVKSVAELFADMVAARRTSSMHTNRSYRKDGSVILCQWCNSVLFNAKGEFNSVLSMALDVTARKEMEERLQRGETMEMLGRTAGGVAHDLNNVLGVMVGLSELLLCQVEADHPLRKSLQTIMESGQRGAAIVQDLLTMTRQGGVIRKPLNLNEIISSYLKTAEYAHLVALHRGFHLQADLDSGLMNISGSNVHLQKMVMNLVLNAMEVTPEGGALTIKTENCYLEAPIKGYEEIGKGEYVVLSLSDTGEGIPSESLPHIFEPFYTTKQMKRSGSGLGLSVVWGVVKEHDGYIDVQSLTGEGTTFKLYFPLTREELPLAIKERRAAGYRGDGESILVVDDEKGQRELALMLLSLLNYRVTAVSSGEEAVEYLKFHEADLVILDMIMESGMDGLDAYREIVKIYPGQKALIVSGFSETERMREAQELGAGAFVKKPYSMEGLGREVKKELDRQ